MLVTMRYGANSAGKPEASFGSSWKLLGSTEITTSSTSTTATSVGTLTIPEAYDANKIIMVRVRDKAGKLAGYLYGSDSFFMNYQDASGATSTITYAGRLIHRVTSAGAYTSYVGATTTGYGVYGYSISSAGVVTIQRRYNSNYSLTINGTYKIEVWAIDYVPGKIFE
jgi:hypothetical protein